LQALHAAAGELAASAARVRQLEAVCDRLSTRVVERERALEKLGGELEQLRSRGDRGLEALAALAAELETVRSQARGQATRIRMRALQDAVELSGLITELGRRPAQARERLLAQLEQAIARLGDPEEAEREPQQPAEGLRPVGDMFEGSVEIEVGPFADFSQLVGFEDAAGGITATSQISVKRFAQGRATLEMKLAEPVELLNELERRTPFEFRVRDQRFDRLVLDLPDLAA
jgi:chromosome segregation ATPase